MLNLKTVLEKLTLLLSTVSSTTETQATIEKLASLLPLLEQYNLLTEYYFDQQMAAHKVATKMLSVMLTVFTELGTKVKKY
jgi:midasin (ATPase involved in ribosome maturation)